MIFIRSFMTSLRQQSWQTWALVGVLLFSLLTRFYSLDNPPTYYFDEVYHAVTAKAYAQNNPAGYEWWHDAPEPGTAYEWLHPPIAKLFMAAGWKYLGQTAWAWRVPGALFGVGVVFLTYWITTLIFENKTIGILAALLASLDGLLLAQSRIGMNDIYVTFFMLAAMGTYTKSRQQLSLSPPSSHRWLLTSGILAGLAMSSKWSGVFTLGMIGVWELLLWWNQGWMWLKRLPRLLFIFGVLPLVIYLASFGQFWFQGHTWSQFVELHNQIWYYQTHLTATHSYQSKAWEWPLTLRPVWYWVKYFDNGTIANIYNLANPILAWSGLVAIIGLLFTPMKKQFKPLLSPVWILPVYYVWSWMPWLLSPRIMFYYHYTPAIPILCIALAFHLNEWWRTSTAGKIVAGFLLAAIMVTFLWLLPMWIGVPLPEKWWGLLFWLPTWK